MRIVTVAVQESSPPEFSAVRVTVTAPGGTTLPAAGDCETVTLHPLAWTSGTRLGMTASQFEFAVRILSVAQVVMCGAAAAVTVTVKSHCGPVLLVQVTSVLPDGNEEPEAGTQVTVPQSPLVVGEL